MNINMKKFFKKNISIVLIWIFFVNFFGINVKNAFAEEKAFDKTVPEITKIETVYSNKIWEFFIYWKNFWKDLENIELVVSPENFDLWLWDWEKNEQKIKVEKIYWTMLSWKISWDYKNWTIVVRKNIWEKEKVQSNKKKIDFWLPVLKKVEAKEWFLWWKKIIFSWENFKKPVYWILWWEKIICDKDTDKICEVTIPKDSAVSWKIWIESYWFETLLDENISVEKTAEVKVSSYSNNLINFIVKWFKFKDLIVPLKTKEDNDLFENWKPIELNWWIWVFIDWKQLSNKECLVNKTLRISCKIDKDIYKKWIWYIDFFWIKTSFFSYDLSKTTPYPTTFSKSVKWSTYQDSKTKKTVEWNRIYLNIWIANFDYQRSSEAWFWQSSKADLKLYFWWKEYLQDNPDLTLSKDKIELKLSSFPSKMKWEIYFKLWNVISDSIPYDFWEYIPELYKVYKWEKKDEFVVEWKNLTNFNDLEASLKFWDISLSTSDIKKIMSEKEKAANEEIKKYEAFIKKAEESELPDESKIQWYKNQILKQEWILRDLENWIYERNYNDNDKKEWEILKKSDTRIVFKVFDSEEYWKSIWKGEYNVSVTSNWIQTNILNFFYDPSISKNIEEAYPEIEKLNFVNWAWDPSKIEIKWKFLDRIKDLYFTDLKAEILKKEKNKILVKVNPEAVLRKKWTIIAKLNDLTMTSNLFFYEFIDDKANKISLNWKKIEKKLDEDWNEIEEDTDDEKKVFNLLLKNTYKNAVFKNLKIKIENLEKSDLPFYDFYLSSPVGNIKWVYDEKKSTINFVNLWTDWGFTKSILVDSDKFYNFDIYFKKINFWKWEVEIKIQELNFYDDFDFPKKISWKKIKFTTTPKFYKVKDEDWKFCREINNKWEFVKCWSEIWKDNDLEIDKNSVFKEEVIKSDFKAIKRDLSKKMDFADINENQWFHKYVENLYQRWIITWYWYGSKEFKPLSSITRAEAVKILLLSRNEDLEGLNYKVFAFQDVPDDHWAKNILEFAVRHKFLTPVKNFHLNKEISRWEAAKLITKFFWRVVPEYSKYSLSDLWEHWSSNNAEYLFQNKIISWVWDTWEFRPKNKVTRSEFVKMISLAIDTWSK